MSSATETGVNFRLGRATLAAVPTPPGPGDLSTERGADGNFAILGNQNALKTMARAP